MKFQSGDKILILTTKERGEVIEWINKEMLIVKVNEIAFPVYADQIDFPYFFDFTDKTNPVKKDKKHIDEVRKEKVVVTQKVVDGVWLVFFPVLDKDIFDDDVISHFKLFVSNHTENEFNFDLSIFYGEKKEIDLRKNIKSFEELYFFDLPFENLNDQPSFEFIFSLQFIDPQKVAHFEVQFKPKGKQIFKKAEELLRLQQASFKYSLFDTLPDKPTEEKFDLSKLTSAGFKLYSSDKAKSFLPQPRTLIDLHIEKLVDNFSSLDSNFILSIQLDAFDKFYEDAIIHQLKSITVIHGVGTGRLKDEIHAMLRLKKDVKSFINRYTILFGYGATEIFIK